VSEYVDEGRRPVSRVELDALASEVRGLASEVRGLRREVVGDDDAPLTRGDIRRLVQSGALDQLASDPRAAAFAQRIAEATADALEERFVAESADDDEYEGGGPRQPGPSSARRSNSSRLSPLRDAAASGENAPRRQRSDNGKMSESRRDRSRRENAEKQERAGRGEVDGLGGWRHLLS
jgi:hypothetical protein